MRPVGLVLFGCGLLLLVSACQPTTPDRDGQTGTPVPQMTVIDSETLTPRAVPTVGSRPTPACPPAPPARLIVQERGRVTLNPEEEPETLNLRAGPGIGFRVLQRIDPLKVFFVLEGPECADDYFWYRVSYDGREGWIAEGDPTGYYAEPYPPG